ncbi:MAG: hypothetical protein ACE5Q6_03125 [Dehalococcoidia bacterium]
MNTELSTYTFLPWLRQGIANRIDAADFDPAVQVRATITVQFDLEGSGGAAGNISRPISKEVALYGPGDIIGIESRAIIKNEPLNWITNFEPNYLPYIEFYDEDFPWRYTPAAPNGGRLRPWITLVVLKEDAEFKEGGNILGKPLPFIEISATPLDSVFPPAQDLWAWAHVHINKNIAGEQQAPQAGDMTDVLSQFKDLVEQDPDMAYSRIVCPRKLEPNSRYHGFLIPTFETGRLAGLNLEPADSPHATFSAWGDYVGRQEPTRFPFYHRWFFRTGARGDFEYLVRLLEPKPADGRVGRRDMDVQDPGSNISGIDDPDLEGFLKLGGALLAPLSDESEAEIQKWEDWDQPYPHAFQTELAEFINLAAEYADKDAATANNDTQLDPNIKNDPDPLITPPIYGRWHARAERLLKNADGTDAPNNTNWLHNLNLDPRWRTAAGFGTDVVKDNQEEYMDAAWDQIGDVLEANRQIRQAQLAQQVSIYWYDQHLKPLQNINPDKVLVMTAPVQKRVVSQGLTVFQQVKQSPLTPAVTSAPLRRMMRPHSRMIRYSAFDEGISPTNLVTRVNAGVVTAAPPHIVPPDLPTLDDVADDLKPRGVPGFLLDSLKNIPLLKYLPLLLAAIVFLLLFVIGFLLVSVIPAVIIIGVLIYFWRLLTRWSHQVEEAESILEENQTPESVDRLPNSPDFTITTPVDITTLDPSNPAGAIRLGGTDSPQSVRFKAALKDLYHTIQVSIAAGEPPPVTPVDIERLADAMIAALDPKVTISRYTYGKIKIPLHVSELIGERFVEAMAYPEFDIPMYKPLVDRSTELFLPNIRFVEQNSITLLKTNQRFIESYMVGLNHEFARELLWREYPTDQRGSYFRQFWDVSSFLSETVDAEQRREELKDIPPLHLWARSSKLGDHDHREQGRDNEEELVLVIRGELLKKYPNAVIYAHQARWQPKSGTDPTPDKTLEREFDPAGPIKSPLYEAKVEPDIFFFGFDITEEEAKGDDTVDDKPGWFFVIKERPGEPRFGLDIEKDPADKIWVWNDLAWEDVVPGVTSGAFIDLATTPTVPLEPGALPDVEDEKEFQREEDLHLPNWHGGLNAAEFAYILYQAPVLMGVHASEMLPE